MTNSKDVILKLKEVREEKGLSYGDILDLMEKNGDFLSKSTLSRVFAEGSEDIKFRYEDTIRPIANALLDIETIEEDDELDVRAMKSLLKLKMQRIEELEYQLEKEKNKYHDKLEKEREQYKHSLDFMREQLAYKDKRMDEFMDTLKEKDAQMAGMLNHIMNCPFRKNNNEN